MEKSVCFCPLRRLFCHSLFLSADLLHINILLCEVYGRSRRTLQHSHGTTLVPFMSHTATVVSGTPIQGCASTLCHMYHQGGVSAPSLAHT